MKAIGNLNMHTYIHKDAQNVYTHIHNTYANITHRTHDLLHVLKHTNTQPHIQYVHRLRYKHIRIHKVTCSCTHAHRQTQTNTHTRTYIHTQRHTWIHIQTHNTWHIPCALPEIIY